jgi:hypothetical protein
LAVACLAVACGGGRRSTARSEPAAAELPLRCKAAGFDYTMPAPAPILPAPSPPPPVAAPTSPQPADARIPKVGAAWSRYSAEDKALIRSGGFRVGLDELGVYLARGRPEVYWATAIDGQNCKVMVYGIGADPRAVDIAVYACNGSVAHIAPMQTPLPCDRVEAVAPRMVEKNVHFSVQPLERQWQIVEGIAARGQVASDLYVAFGPPYRQGQESREDGTSAAKHVYLDSTGEAYGMNVTLVDGRVVAWALPAERTLTPEAQQRRIDRAVAETEARARARYEEEQRKRNELQAQQQQSDAQASGASKAVHTFLGIAAQAASASASASGGGGEGGQTVVSHQSTTRQVSGEKSLTVNGCRYTDGPNGALGASCSGKSPCPGGYTCSLLGGPSGPGMCVPAGQPCKR